MCFHYEPKLRAKETNREVKPATIATKQAEPKFARGTKVRVLRKAHSLENGWNNSWVEYMDSAVGKIAEVVSTDPGFGVRLNFIGSGSGYQYPEFVLEAVQTGFKTGDRVRVTAERGGPYKLEPATITRDYQGHVDKLFYLKFDSPSFANATPAFYADSLEFLPAAKPAAIRARSVYEIAKSSAIEIAKKKRVVNADEVQAQISTLGYSPAMLGNAAGAVFRSTGWVKVGEVRSTRVGNRGRKIAQWRYYPAELVGV